jgi:hypothetical protein
MAAQLTVSRVVSHVKYTLQQHEFHITSFRSILCLSAYGFAIELIPSRVGQHDIQSKFCTSTTTTEGIKSIALASLLGILDSLIRSTC